MNGFGKSVKDLQATQKWVAEINQTCCQKRKVNWIIDPKLFDRYHVTVAPSFVLGFGTSAKEGDYSLVAGDMTLANALKFFNKESKIEKIREEARHVYNKTYANTN